MHGLIDDRIRYVSTFFVGSFYFSPDDASDFARGLK